MARRKKNSGGIFATLIWMFVIASLALSWFKTPVEGNPGNFMEWGQAKSAAVEKWIHSWSDGASNIKLPTFTPGTGSGPGTGGSDGAPGAPGTDNGTPVAPVAPVSESRAKLDTLKIADASKVDYERDEWKHWNTVSGCWNVREEVLARDAAPGSLVYLDKNDKETTSKANACSIKSGSWVDVYSGKSFTDPSKLDIDHMIPLSYAAQHGGQGWDANKKSQYANSLENGHLITSSAAQNRSKGDKGPGEWKPSDRGSWCTYATNWISVSSTWGLSATEDDKKELISMLETCK